MILRVDRPCAMCTHIHACERDSDLRVWLCDDCMAYVNDENPWSSTDMCTQMCALCDKPLNDGKPAVKGESGYVHKACVEADEKAATEPKDEEGSESRSPKQQELAAT